MFCGASPAGTGYRLPLGLTLMTELFPEREIRDGEAVG
jgi:hypothetical protein